MKSFFVIAALCVGASSQAATETLTVQMKDGQGKSMGTATLKEIAKGVEIDLDLQGLPAGEKAFHIHGKGVCTGPKFESAGPHFATGNEKHGHVEGGPHHGDMSNVKVSDKGVLKTKIVNERVSLVKKGGGFLRGSEGTALVLHAKPDDYKSQPAGDAGDRILCGVISAPTAATPKK